MISFPSIRIFLAAVVAACLCGSFVGISAATAQPEESESGIEAPPIELGEEYREYSKTSKGRAPAESRETSTFEKVLFYLPNRFLDLLDVVHADVGVGCGYGGVIRITKWGQFGSRTFCPGSLRVGLNGRKSPIFWESRDASGFGSDFRESSRRTVSSGELGAGVDAVLVGFNFGISPEELVDFLLGFGGIDIGGDDLGSR